MPLITVVYYMEEDGSAPVLEWLQQVAHRERRAARKCELGIERLVEMGHELRRPEADILRDGIYELRIHLGRVNYRILYFFHGQSLAVLAHGLVKEAEVPDKEIEIAIQRRGKFSQDPKKHTYRI